MLKYITLFLGVLFCIAPCALAAEEAIKAFCVDFNWGPGGDNAFAGPGHWGDADPATHVAWYEGLGVNTIQTFAVSCNGYAWYKDGEVPEQPNGSRNQAHQKQVPAPTVGRNAGPHVENTRCRFAGHFISG